MPCAARALARSRSRSYVRKLGEAIGHADRHEPLRAYVTGLLLSGERKSVEPMATRIDPRRVSARHQSMHHFVASAPWDERTALAWTFLRGRNLEGGHGVARASSAFPPEPLAFLRAARLPKSFRPGGKRPREKGS
jgi:DDE superfamily endonuclease